MLHYKKALVLIGILICMGGWFYLKKPNNIKTWAEYRNEKWAEKNKFNDKLTEEKAVLAQYCDPFFIFENDQKVINALQALGENKECSLPFKIVFCCYLLQALDTKQKNNENPLILKELLVLQKMDEENSLPNYLLGYYFQNIGNEKEAFKYYDQAFQQSKFKLYSKDCRKMISVYLIENSLTCKRIDTLFDSETDDRGTRNILLRILRKSFVSLYKKEEDLNLMQYNLARKILNEAQSLWLLELSSNFLPNGIEKIQIKYFLNLLRKSKSKMYENFRGESNLLEFLAYFEKNGEAETISQYLDYCNNEKSIFYFNSLEESRLK